MKVLILYSWNDMTGKNRYEIMTKSPLIKSYTIRQCFVMNSPDGNINVARFKKSLCLEIKNFAPQVLLVHAGIAFHRYPNEILEVLRKVKRTYPELRIGIEQQASLLHYFSDYDIFDKGEEMKRIQKLFFLSVFRDAKP